MKKGIFLAGAALTALWLTGCSPQDAANLRHDTQQLGHDIGPAVTGAALVTKVTTHLALHKGVTQSGLHFDADGSTVTVSGHVKDEHAKQTVLNVVKETTGVDKVVDKLRVEK